MSDSDHNVEIYKDSPPSSPAGVLSSPVKGNNPTSSSNSEDGEDPFISDSSQISPPSSPVAHGHKRSSYATYKYDPSVPIPRQTLHEWKRKRLDGGASNDSHASSHADEIEETSRKDERQEAFVNREDCDPYNSDTSNPSSVNHLSSQDSIHDSDEENGGNEKSDSSVIPENSNDSDISDCGSGDPDGNGLEIEVGSLYGDHFDPFEDNSLYPGCEKTTDEAICELLNIYLCNNISKTALGEILKFYNSSLPFSHTMPRTVHFLLKYVESMSIPLDEVEHFYCTAAMHTVNTKEGPCNVCDCTDIGVFYELPIESSLKFLFEHRNLGELIDTYYETRMTKENGKICDIVDGSEYSRIWQGNMSKYKLTLILNTDGVSPYVSSKAKMWPLMFTIMEIPPHLRSSFTVVWGIWFDKKLKPSMNLFLKPFVASLVKINEQGGISWQRKSGEIMLSPVRAPVFVADAPARAALLNMQEHQAKYACNACVQKTNKLPAPPVLPGMKKKKRKRRFLFQEDPAELRTHQSMVDLGRYVSANDAEPKRGIKGTTVIEDIPLIDLSTCALAEYMHCVLKGITAQICSLWFFVKGDWFIGDRLSEINDFLCSNIHPPDFVTRLPRSLDYFSYLKANELRSFLLYFSLVVVAPFLKDKYYQHWILFVQAIFLLLTESISEEDLVSAEVLLRLFLRDLGDLYGDDQYTYNVHQLAHLVMYVRRWGGLWSNSAFGFESFNGVLSRMIHGSKNEGRELLNQMYLAQGAQLLRNKTIRDGRNMSTTKGLGKPLSRPLSEHEYNCLSKLNLNVAEIILYGRVSIGRQLLSSKEYDKNFKRRNSYVQFKYLGSYKYGRIIVFCKFDNRFVCLVAVYRVLHTKFIFHTASHTRVKHIIPVEDTSEIIACELNDIKKKLIQVGDYLCDRPNTVEVNL